VVLSGNDIGSIKATSRAPKTKPPIVQEEFSTYARGFSENALRSQHLTFKLSDRRAVSV